MLNRSAILRNAWKAYRASVYARGPFDRIAFGRALTMAWNRAKRAAAVEAERARRAAEEEAEIAARGDEADDYEFSPLEQAIRATSYLPAHMSAAAAEARIRSAYAARGIHA